MPRVHHVACARKDNPAVKKGEPYYWWKTRITVGKSYVSHMHYSKTRPPRSQLTNSEFLSQMYDIEDTMIAKVSGETPEDLESARDEIISELESLQSETQDKLDNMPEGLQQGGAGETLQERIDACGDMISELESIDFSYDKESDGDLESWLESRKEEIQQVGYGG